MLPTVSYLFIFVNYFYIELLYYFIIEPLSILILAQKLISKYCKTSEIISFSIRANAKMCIQRKSINYNRVKVPCELRYSYPTYLTVIVINCNCVVYVYV